MSEPLRSTESKYTQYSTLSTSSDITGDRFNFDKPPKVITLLDTANIDWSRDKRLVIHTSVSPSYTNRL